MENATLTKSTLNWLFDAARWARFLAIMGFVFVGFMVLAGIFIGPVLSFLNEDMSLPAGNPQISGSLIAGIYLIIAILYFFPVYFLFQFSNRFIKAYKSEDEESLNASFQFLQKHFKFVGILVIVVLVIYILAFIVGTFALIAGFA